MSRLPSLIAVVVAAFSATAQEPAVITSRWSRVEAALALLDQRHVVVSPKDLESGILTGIISAADPSGQLIPGDDFAAFEKALAGLVANPGWKLSATNHMVVFQEALDAGCNPCIPAGWMITRLDGKSTATNSWASVAHRLRRPTAGPLNLELTEPLKGVTTNLTVQLDHVPEPSVARLETWLGDVLYVRLNGMHPRSGPDLQAALKPDPAHRGMILDLRDAGGEDIDSVLASAALFCGPDKVLAQWMGLDDSGASDLRSAPWTGPVVETPVLLLINARTRGASELFAALIARCGGGVLLVGESSSGDPLLRESIPLADGPFLHVATRKLVFANGAILDSRTILAPDVKVADVDLDEPPPAGDNPLMSQNHLRAADTAAHAAGVFLQNRIRHDAVLKRAVDIMLGLRAVPPKSR